jgi:hypothetical protein
VNPQQRVKLVVDGRAMEVPLEEVVRRAQINKATDSRLEEAKRLLSETKAVHRNRVEELDERDERPQYHTPTPGATNSPNERMRSIVERIQMGDTDEGMQALTEFANAIPDAVRATMQAENDRAQMSAALNRFTARYPQVLQDPDLGMAGYTVLARTIREDLNRAGVTDEQLAAARIDPNNVVALGHAAAALRRHGHKVGSFEDHLNAAAGEMSRKFSIRPGNQAPRSRIASPEEIRARLDQKQRSMQRPRAAGLRMEAPEPSRPKTPAEIVAEARRARGFPRTR